MSVHNRPFPIGSGEEEQCMKQGETGDEVHIKSEVCDSELTNIEEYKERHFTKQALGIIGETNVKVETWISDDLPQEHCACVLSDAEEDGIIGNAIVSEEVSPPENLKPYACTQCQFRSKQRGNLFQHVRGVHGNLRPFKCAQCDFACKVKGNLMQHINSVHEKLRPFKCTLCDYRCNYKNDLKKHNRCIHENVKPFLCSQCDYSCKLSSSLNNHVKTIHVNSKPFHCHKCNYRTNLKSCLNQHLKRIHENLKPYKCTLCHYCCNQRKYLMKHMKSYHENRKQLDGNSEVGYEYPVSSRPPLVFGPFKCSQCEFTCSWTGELIRHVKIEH